nr:hypothetical protein [Tanacetum cinerariifolium]
MLTCRRTNQIRSHPQNSKEASVLKDMLGANIEPNKADSEEVADLDPDQLPTSAFVVLVSSIIPILNLSHQTFSH